jgi:hypothetical protein
MVLRASKTSFGQSSLLSADVIGNEYKAGVQSIGQIMSADQLSRPSQRCSSLRRRCGFKPDLFVAPSDRHNGVV